MTPSNSTLAPWLVGTRYRGDRIEAVSYSNRRAVTRVVTVGGKNRRLPIPVLQDLLLLEKGYEGKYSGLSVGELQALKRGQKKRSKKRT